MKKLLAKISINRQNNRDLSGLENTMKRSIAKQFLAVSILVGLQALLMGATHAQQLQIISPADGSTAAPGQTITITVSGSTSVLPPFWVFTQDPLPDVQPTASPTSFSLTIPTTFPAGIYYLTAVGGLNGSAIESPAVAIDVEPLGQPIAIQVSPSFVQFSTTNEDIPLQVYGTFNGQQINITNSTHTAYLSQNPAIVTVSSAGVLSSVAAGGTNVQVTYSSLSFSVPVRVPLGQATPAYNVTIAPTSPISINSNGNYVLFVLVTNNSNVDLTSVAITAATLNATSPLTSPTAVANIAPGTSRSITYVFPPSAGPPGSPGVFRIQGQYIGTLPGGAQQGGALSGTFRIIL